MWTLGSENLRRISTVPSVAMKSGVFPNAIYDPATTTGTGATATRALYPNNTVPASAVNSIGRTLALTYPDPNRANSGSNYIRTARYTTALQNLTVRHDYTLSERDSFFARFSMNRGAIAGESALPEPAGTGVSQHAPGSIKRVRVSMRSSGKQNVDQGAILGAASG